MTVALVTLGVSSPASPDVPAVQDVAGTSGLLDIACPSASNCVATGDIRVNGTVQAVVVPITNGTPGPPQQVPGVLFLTGIACPSATLCYAVGDGVVVPITNGTVGTPISTSAALQDVACASPTSCVAVGVGPAGVPITNGVVGTPVAYPLVSGTTGGNLVSVACPTSSGCSAYGTDTGQICVPHFPCATDTEFQEVTIGSDASYVSSSRIAGGVGSSIGAGDVSCPSASTCYQTGTEAARSFVLNWPTSSTENDIPGAAGYGFGLDCTSVAACVGVGTVPVSGGYEGAVIGMNDGQPSAPKFIPGVGGTGFAGLESVSCPTASSCYAVGDTFVNGIQEGAVVSLTPSTTSVLVPQDNATLSGTTFLDAAASDAAGVTGVEFHLTGGTLNDSPISSATPTLFGWIGGWDTTSVANGSYTLDSLATDVEGFTAQSGGITVNVNNPPPSTLVGLPAPGAAVSGNQYLDASASPGVTQVQYEISGGPNNYINKVISGSAATYYGWIGGWSTSSVPNGTYKINSVASYAGGVSGTSPSVTFTVAN
jgi:hypothetical protein